MINPQAWNRIVALFPLTHVLQTWQWGLVKQRFGWEVLPKIWQEGGEILASALILKRAIRFPLIGTIGSLLYVPKGPLIHQWDDFSLVQRVLGDLEALAREQKAVLVKVDPDVEYKRGESGFDWPTYMEKDSPAGLERAAAEGSSLGMKIVSLLKGRGWIFSREQVQFRNTMVLDLTLSETELLKGMKQKTRYNIRLAEKNGLQIRLGSSEDIPLLYRMYRETSLRDGFIIRDEEYYTTVWGTFLNNHPFPQREDQPTNGSGDALPSSEPFARVLIAEYEGEPLAGLILFIFRGKAWYMYGMSTDRHRQKMPNYLLHWRAIQTLQEMGVKEYDLWGAPDRFEETDPMYGVYRFKVGFGAQAVQHIGAWDFPVSARKYRLYQETLPKYLHLYQMLRRKD